MQKFILSTHLKLSNWISNNNLAFIGMSPGMPLEPYASNGLAVMMALSPIDNSQIA